MFRRQPVPNGPCRPHQTCAVLVIACSRKEVRRGKDGPPQPVPIHPCCRVWTRDRVSCGFQRLTLTRPHTSGSLGLRWTVFTPVRNWAPGGLPAESADCIFQPELFASWGISGLLLAIFHQASFDVLSVWSVDRVQEFKVNMTLLNSTVIYSTSRSKGIFQTPVLNLGRASELGWVGTYAIHIYSCNILNIHIL